MPRNKSTPKPAARTSPKDPEKITPGPRTRAAIDKATRATEERPVRTYVTWEETSEGHKIAASPHNDAVGNGNQMLNTFGTTSSSFLHRNFTSLEAAVRGRGDDRGDEPMSVNAALALMEAIGPQDELEGALAVQMASSHALTMEMLCRAKSTESAEHLAMYGNLAVKLQRTFTAQIEALGRMRGKGQQTVRVEHVNVHPGGQAIVGDVHHHPRGKQGGNPKSEEPPHETWSAATGAQEREALPCQDATGDGVPVAGNAERPVQDSRRPIDRRGTRKSERA